MKGSRNRTVWLCPDCRRALYSRRAWSSHLWDKHRLALIRKKRRSARADEALVAAAD